jgi:hypothetical protein
MQIIEATRHPLWGVGLPFTSQQIRNQNSWTGKNLMGHVLHELREGLAMTNVDAEDSGEKSVVVMPDLEQ